MPTQLQCNETSSRSSCTYDSTKLHDIPRSGLLRMGSAAKAFETRALGCQAKMNGPPAVSPEGQLLA
ncbi:MAG: hypothetical protein WCF26_07205 [Candidatus Sulfotelmatobacter sp.]